MAGYIPKNYNLIKEFVSKLKTIRSIEIMDAERKSAGLQFSPGVEAYDRKNPH